MQRDVRLGGLRHRLTVGIAQVPIIYSSLNLLFLMFVVTFAGVTNL